MRKNEQQRDQPTLRTAYFVPYMTSTIAITTIFMQLFVEGGVAAAAPSVVGIPDQTWYASTHLALAFLVIVYVYVFVGLYIVIFTGGMETIPRELYEAACPPRSWRSAGLAEAGRLPASASAGSAATCGR